MDHIPLRDLVEQRLDLHWSDFARRHPHLAAAIDRTRLIETTMRSLADDPALRAALRDADLDEATLVAASRVIGVIERAVSLALKL